MNVMENGRISMDRKISESKIFAYPTALKIWLWCLLKATDKERFVPFSRGKGRGSMTIKLLPRQFVFGRSAAVKELHINGNTIYMWLRKFASDDFNKLIEIKCHRSHSIITISKYVNYRSDRDGALTSDSQVRFDPKPANNQDMSDMSLTGHQHKQEEEYIGKSNITNNKEKNNELENLKYEDFLDAGLRAREIGKLIDEKWKERLKGNSTNDT